MNPIMLRDPEFGPVRLRAFGSYAIKVVDPGLFLKQIVGTDNRFTTEEITGQLRNLIVSQFGTILGQSKVPMLDLAGKYAELGAFIRQQMSAEFGKVGLDLPTFVIENISLPEEVEKALDKRASMGVIGDLGRYTQMQAADSMPIAAGNPSAGAGAGMGLGMGVAMGQQMAAALGAAGAGQPRGATPPPLPGQAAASYFAAINGQQAGPFDVAALGAQARAGAVGRDTLVWCEGMSGWAPAGTVPGLAGLFPPPLPPQAPAQG
jgi:membrane protease subunit (stomatin/prohibitin family)